MFHLKERLIITSISQYHNYPGVNPGSLILKIMRSKEMIEHEIETINLLIVFWTGQLNSRIDPPMAIKNLTFLRNCKIEDEIELQNLILITAE
jgi:hypothetical protein